MKAILLTVFFLLELAAIAVFSFWGYQINAGMAVKIIVAVAAPLVTIILWGMFLSPKASVPIFSYQVRTAFKLFVFIVASAAIWAVGQFMLAIIFLLLSLIVIASVFLLNLHEVNKVN
ncbi:YrdB family protein [Paenibacillus sp. YAF4_2]|uniref:YrdB family protein n=1 Tax=Paenibacillus sp. YAF4_2 TaxID=3233085 RepID=UPI003F9E3C3A